MKKRSASDSAFLNLRVLSGLFLMLAGVFLALVSFGTFSSVFAQTNRTELTHAPAQPVGVAPSESSPVVWSDNRNDLLGGAPRKDPNVYYNQIALTSTSCSSYVIRQIGGSIVPGTTDIGNHCDDCVTTVALPFSYTLYDQTFNTVNLSSNGNAQFTTTDAAFTNICLPWLTHSYTIYPYWDDQYTVFSGFGIFTSVSGTAPNRIFNIEWRNQYFPGVGTANYELRLYEGQTRFDVIYGTLTNSNASATAGVQRDNTSFTQYFCNGSGGQATGGQSYALTATRGEGTIYNIGGFPGPTNTTRIYDPRTNTWTTGAPLPTPLTDHATAYWNGKIYVAAGFNGSAAVNTLYIYDIANNSWTTGAPLPQALYLPGFGIINGKLYIASGSNGTELNTLYIYDIGSNTWTTGANVPVPVTGPGSAVYNGKLYLFGGGFPTPLKITQIYDPGSNTWSFGPFMNVARLWFYGAAIDNTSIVAPGGDTVPGIPTNVSEQLTGSWTVRANLPYNATGPFAVSDGRFVYIGGGFDGGTARADLLRYDPISGTYTALAPSPDGHYLSQAIIVTRSTYDFNHDGKPDYVLYKASTHQTAVWYMNSNVFAGGVFGPTLPTGWNVRDVADFNSDGNLDYALFNPTTRQTAIWYLSGVTFAGSAYGPTLPTGWALVATGDFNDDCEPDYVLYNASTRRTAIWYMNNNVFVNGAYGPTLPPGWSLVGVADFNGDGKRDYLLVNASTRQTAIWYLSGVNFLSSAYGPMIASGYQLQGTADFNGDGKPDYLLYNPSTRQTAIWYLNNNIFLGGAYGPILPTGWNLVAP